MKYVFMYTVCMDGNIVELCLIPSFQVSFLRYPPNIGCVVPLVITAHMAGVLVFCSPDLGYKLGEIIGMDPLQSAYASIVCCFVAIILFALFER